ncbi:MAG TPA: hypothetical protein VGX70_12295 [Gemmataceae bacterium]|jgi:hypothetical protein|nr:hypothetical protein [Gemmataceae bacterium]
MDSHNPEWNEIEGLLTGTPGQASEELRQAIQRKTLTALRRRRWVRRSVWVAGLTGCYAAGILTMAFLRSPASPSIVATDPETELPAKASPDQATSEKKKPEHVPPPDSALALEWQALDSEQKRPDLFLLAGDKYLQGNDLKSAMRCYRGALEGASEHDLLITAKDTWLLMSLKEAKVEENRYAKLDRP